MLDKGFGRSDSHSAKNQNNGTNQISVSKMLKLLLRKQKNLIENLER
jgi:hypothetical protein